MSDPISAILKVHIAQAEQQLAWMKRGVSFSDIDLDCAAIPRTQKDTEALIAQLEGELKRHEDRLAHRT